MIGVTVGMPIYDMQDISWLGFESLCRQQSDVGWELIVVEEEENNSVDALIKENEDRLTAAGCERIQYIPVQWWLPLSTKYYIMSKLARGKVFMLQAGDCYSHKDRIHNSYNALKTKRYDWFMSSVGTIYNIKTGQTILFDHKLSSHPCGQDLAWRTELMQHLEISDRARSVDHWLFTSMEEGEGRPLKKRWEKKGTAINSVHTWGCGKLSRSIGGYFNRVRPPFVDTEIDALEILPKDISVRLRNMLGYGMI